MNVSDTHDAVRGNDVLPNQHFRKSWDVRRGLLGPQHCCRMELNLVFLCRPACARGFPSPPASFAAARVR